MSDFKLIRFEILSVGSILSNKSGHLPHKARFRKHFVNHVTGEYVQCTDLESKKYKRSKHLREFQKTYLKQYAENKISILTIVLKEVHYKSPSSFINMISKKLKRNGINKLGYVWIRDVDEKTLLKHSHLILAISRIDTNEFKTLFASKNHNGYDVQFQRTRKGLRDYLSSKEIYGMKNQRSYGRSKLFKKPINTR